MTTTSKPTQQIKQYITSLQWYIKQCARDKNIQIPFVRPLIYNHLNTELATTMFYVLEDVKNFIEDEMKDK